MERSRINYSDLLKHALSLILLVLGSFLVSYLLYVWLDYPRGNDAVSHLFKLKFVLDFFPNINWTHTWAGGMPLFALYPALPYILMAIVQRVSGIGIREVLTASAVFFGVGLASFGIYLAVYRITKSWFTSFAAGLIYLTTPSVWSAAFSGGLYARALALPFVVLALWSGINLWLLERSNRSYKLFFVLTVFFIGLSFMFHFVVGAVALGSVLLLGFFISPSFGKLVELSKLLFLTILFSAASILPLIVKYPSNPNLESVDFIQRLHYLVTPWSRLFYLVDTNKQLLDNQYFLNAPHWLRLTPFILPLLAIMLCSFFLMKKRISPKTFRIILFLTISTCALTIYTSFVFPFLRFVYSTFGGPEVALFYLPIFASLAVGILWSLVFSGKKIKVLSSFILIVAVIGWFTLQFGFIWMNPQQPYVRQKSFDDVLFKFAKEIIPANQFNFRLGDGDDNGTLASWLNIEYPLVPQTRDYFLQGVVNQDYYAYKDVVIWHQENNLEQTNFLLDWWGIEQFLVSHDGKVVEKFKNQDQYRDLGGSILADAYRFVNAAPILAPTNSPAVLVVGDKGYDFVFRGLARGNMNSRVIIPVIGKVFIDDYDSKELSQFKAIFLYNWRFHNSDKAQGLLSGYVKNGGRLVIESNAAEESQGKLFDPFPIVSAKRGEISWKWDFSENGNSADLSDINDFGPPEFNGGPWGVSFAEGVKDWARAVLFAKGKPIVVMGDFGKGTVVWTGLNLPFHANYYNNSQESKFLTGLLLGHSVVDNGFIGEKAVTGSVFATETYHINTAEVALLKTGEKGTGYEVEFVNPQERKVKIDASFSGILFKEFYVSNWQAFLISGKNRTRMRVYRAGPEFMYVPLNNVRVGDLVILKYVDGLDDIIGKAVSLGTFVLLLLYIFDWWIFKGFVAKVAKLARLPLRMLDNWWVKED